MRKTIYILLFTFLFPSVRLGAQYVTYNHDATKMNQVTVMETGAGELTPALFYSLVHGRYYETASSTSKLLYRSEAAAHGSVQVEIAHQIDTSLARRAEVEALNIADRQADLAWQAEGPRIQSALDAFRRNIARLSEAGGTAADMRLWEDRQRLFETAVSAVRGSFIPNADRKREYLAIYRDITEGNDTLVEYIAYVYGREKTRERLKAELTLPDRNAETASGAFSRWKSSSTSNNP